MEGPTAEPYFPPRLLNCPHCGLWESARDSKERQVRQERRRVSSGYITAAAEFILENEMNPKFNVRRVAQIIGITQEIREWVLYQYKDNSFILVKNPP